MNRYAEDIVSFRAVLTLLLSALLLCSPSLFITALLAEENPAQHLLPHQQKPDEKFKQQLLQAIEEADEFEDKFAAQVWLVDMSYRLSKRAPHIPENERLELLALVHKEATRNKLNPQVILSLIQVESNFDRFALSKVGARGLMQIMPFWMDSIGREDDNLFDIATNIRYGCAILAIYYKREKAEIIPALARYHGSYPKVYYSQRVVKAWQGNWLFY